MAMPLTQARLAGIARDRPLSRLTLSVEQRGDVQFADLSIDGVSLIWSDFEHNHRPWVYDLVFVFEREAYERALSRSTAAGAGGGVVAQRSGSSG